jgi:hypothetical protein
MEARPVSTTVDGRILSLLRHGEDPEALAVGRRRIAERVRIDGMIMPDHAPTIAGDKGHRQAFAFEFGYRRADEDARVG